MMLENQSMEYGLKALELFKRKHEENKQYRKENGIIFVHRKQINTNYPAIALLRIEFPKQNDNLGLFFEKFCEKQPIGADYYILRRVNDYVYELEVRSTKMMYTWLERFCDRFSKQYENVKIGGYWDKYEH